MHDVGAIGNQAIRGGAKPRMTDRKPTSRKMSRAGMVLLTVVTLSGSVIVLGACNTTAGVGQDVSATGHAVSGAAERAKQAF